MEQHLLVNSAIVVAAVNLHLIGVTASKSLRQFEVNAEAFSAVLDAEF